MSTLSQVIAAVAFLLLPGGVTASPPSSRTILSTVQKHYAPKSSAILRPSNLPNEFSPRFLQDDVCSAPSNVFDDDDTLSQFFSAANPVCSCEDLGNYDFTDYLAENPFPEDAVVFLAIQEWLDDFNEYTSDLQFGERSGCRNECSVCVSPDLCYVLDSEIEATSQVGFAQIFTISDFTSIVTEEEVDDALDSRLRVYSTSYSDKTCYTMTTGDETGETLCLALKIDFDSVEGTPVALFEEALSGDDSTVGCVVTVNDVMCASCEVNLETECVALDCSNIEGNAAVLDSCDTNEDSFTGIYRLLYESGDHSYSLGSCSGAPPTPEAPTKAPVIASAPTNAPLSTSTDVPVIATTPTDAPLSSQSDAPVMAAIPTESPVTLPMDAAPTGALVVTTYAPAMSPNEETATNAPATSATTEAPVQVSPTSDTSGCEVIVTHLLSVLVVTMAVVVLH